MKTAENVCVCVCVCVCGVCMTFLLSPGITGLNTLPIYEIIELAKLLYYYYILLDKNPLTKYWIELYANESSAISLSLICRIYSTNKKFINVSKY